MKSYIELVQETLNQRAIIDNRNIVQLSDTSESVLIAFNQACEFMRDLHNWKWNLREETYVNNANQRSYPMPYGIVHTIKYKKDSNSKEYYLSYIADLKDSEEEPKYWSHKWDNETLLIDSTVIPINSESTVVYHDKNIAVLGSRTSANPTLLERFSSSSATNNQFLNIPEYIYDAYARCVVLKTRIFLNENAQTTIFPAQQQEWNEAYNGLMSFAKTPLYTERMEI